MDADLAAAVSEELHRFVDRTGSRRTLPPTCHVGVPAADQVRLPVVTEPSLRADLVERAIDGLVTTTGACAWLTRGGSTETIDSDLGWLAACRHAFGRHGLPLPAFFVVTRTAWVDLVSGEQRNAWSRVRPRRRAA